MAVRSEKAIWLTLVALQLTYVILSRVVVSSFGMYTLHAECIRMPVRLVFVILYWVLFRDLLTSKKLTPLQVSQPPFLAAILVFVSVPLLVGDSSYMDLTTKSIYAAGSVIVGLREEFFYRGLVQNLLSQRIGNGAAILLATVIFTLCHIGVIPLVWFAYIQVIVAGLLFGIIYAKTRNLWIVVTLHSLYDALWSLTPIFNGPIVQYRYGIVLLCLSLAGATWWGWKAICPDEQMQSDEQPRGQNRWPIPQFISRVLARR